MVLELSRRVSFSFQSFVTPGGNKARFSKDECVFHTLRIADTRLQVLVLQTNWEKDCKEPQVRALVKKYTDKYYCGIHPPTSKR